MLFPVQTRLRRPLKLWPWEREREWRRRERQRGEEKRKASPNLFATFLPPFLMLLCCLPFFIPICCWLRSRRRRRRRRRRLDFNVDTYSTYSNTSSPTFPLQRRGKKETWSIERKAAFFSPKSKSNWDDFWATSAVWRNGATPKKNLFLSLFSSHFCNWKREAFSRFMCSSVFICFYKWWCWSWKRFIIIFLLFLIGDELIEHFKALSIIKCVCLCLCVCVCMYVELL